MDDDTLFSRMMQRKMDRDSVVLPCPVIKPEISPECDYDNGFMQGRLDALRQDRENLIAPFTDPSFLDVSKPRRSYYYSRGYSAGQNDAWKDKRERESGKYQRVEGWIPKLPDPIKIT